MLNIEIHGKHRLSLEDLESSISWRFEDAPYFDKLAITAVLDLHSRGVRGYPHFIRIYFAEEEQENILPDVIKRLKEGLKIDIEVVKLEIFIPRE